METNYLIRALNSNNNEIKPLELINIIRIYCGKSIIHTGAEGEDHYATVAKRERDIVNKILSSLDPIDGIEPDENNEDQEIEDIAKLFKNEL